MTFPLYTALSTLLLLGPLAMAGAQEPAAEDALAGCRR